MKQNIYSRTQKTLCNKKRWRLKKNGNWGTWKMRRPDFPGSRVAWDSSTFSQNGLTNIKHYLYFFSLTLKIHELSAANWSTPLYFPCKMRNFFDSLDFFFHNFYTFFFFFSMNYSSFAFFFIFTTWFDASSAFLLTLMLFLPPGPGNPGWEAYLEASRVI